MLRRALRPLAALALIAGCGTSWKVDDIDGDGVTSAEGDCWDSLEEVPGFGVTGDQIYPGAADAWYDGLDQNCDGKDDYDADGDGYVPAEFIGLVTFGVPGSGVDHPAEPDCWDAEVGGEIPSEFTVVVDADFPYPQPTADRVNPGAAPGASLYEAGWNTDADGWVDFWYDGVDLNCDGVDEFDQDGDGYASQHHADQDGVTGDDCIDGSPRDDVNLAETDAGDVNPGVAETWWDGTDQDCDYDTTVDCDADADGFRGDPTVDIESLGLSACGFEDEEAVDCNDELAEVFPTDDPEIFYNGADDNCDYSDRDGDKDGDGGWAMDYLARVAASGGAVDPATVTVPASPGDCWDDPDRDASAAGSANGFNLNVQSGFSELSAGEVFRDASDRPYDGADQDCRPSDNTGNGTPDDFDWDNDSYEVEAYENLSLVFGDDCVDCPDDCFSGAWAGTIEQDWCDAYCPVQDDNPAALPADEINPGVTPEYDVAYDGTDQNCDDWNDWDYDRDGEIHMNAAAYGGPSGGTDCHEGADLTTGFSIDDTLAYPNPAGLDPDQINTATAETWYDGTDQDCDAWPSDYDADKDGDDHEAHAGDDCFEGTAADVDTNPGGVAPASINVAAAETWYDGTDQNCDDWSDDDADRDGQDHEEQGGADCYEGTGLDLDGNPAGLAATAIKSGAADTWYDGTDANCDDNDGDADGDGHYIDTYAHPQHAASAYPEDDCDDTDSLINPDEDEIAGDEVDQDCDTDELCYVDADDDGYRLTSTLTSNDLDCTDSGEAVSGDSTDECDDTDPTVNGGASEVCDGQDNDCDGATPSDEVDDDGDGYVECTWDSGGWDGTVSVVGDEDCDDTDALEYPSAAEICDGQDNDCDGSLPTDESDDDGDGYVECTIHSGGWDGSSASITGGDDCDDADSGDYPGAVEIEGNQDDEDCDGGEICFVDADDDGYRPDATATLLSADTDCTDPGEAVSTDPTTDCDDADSGDYPGATEIVGNEDDEDCDGGEVCYVDSDDDGYRPDATSTLTSSDDDCSDPGEAVASDPTTDCDDGDAGDYPGAPETIGNSDDEDCDGGEICYLDADNDGYRPDATSTVTSSDTDCTDAGEAVSTDPTTDCDDGDANDYPGATETVANGDDEDCDGQEICYVDADDDGYRLTSTVVSADGDCNESGEALATDPTLDCDDTDAGDYPGATEIVGNEDDEDCDGGEICYVDADDDSYRLTTTVTSADADCADPGEAPSSDPTGDCDDTDAGDYPGATEIVGNEDDEDCDGAEVCYVDADDDGYRPNATDTVASADTDCDDSGEADSSQPITDCDDTLATVNPAATETVGNEIDNDCDGGEICYVDVDSDGYRPDSTTTVVSADDDCGDTGEAAGTDPDGDCDDATTAINPGAAEIVGDEVDQDCDGAEVCYADADDDGYRLTATVASADDDCSDSGEAVSGDPSGDCDDTDAGDNPGATETVGNGDDEDCDGGEICYVDVDDDGYRPDGTSTVVSADGDCADSGEALSSEPITDCDDTLASVNPGATEVVGNEIDNDCDGTELCYIDVDGDGYRPDASTVVSSDDDCSDAGEALSSVLDGDCDDNAASVNPGATDLVGDELDQDCDGIELCYSDADGDGDVDELGTTIASADEDCVDTGEADDTAPQTDCDDDDATVSGAFGTEGASLDGKDNDCDDSYDEGSLFDGDELYITEIMFQPGTGEGEWFEVYNATAVDLTLNEDWEITDISGGGTNSFTLTAPVVIPAGEHVIFSENATLADDTTAATVVFSGLDLGNGGDTITLLFHDPTTTAITADVVDYSGFSLPSGGGTAIQLDNSGTVPAPIYPADNTVGASWCSAADSYDGGTNDGTPAASNEGC